MKRIMVGVAYCLLAGAARAEMDYEFARALLDRSEADFETHDIVARLAEQLDANPATKTEGKHVRAILRRRHAAGASIEKQKALLDEAHALYGEVLADARYRHLALAAREADDLGVERIKRTRQVAEQLKPRDAQAAAMMLAEAARELRPRAEKYRAEAAPLRAAFEPHFRRRAMRRRRCG
jgi:hypothetical protein